MSLLDIFANPALVIKLRLIVYAVLVFFSFFIFIGVAVMKDESTGSCPLYCDKDGCGSVSNCNFPMAIAIMFQLLFLLFRIATLLLLLLGKFTADFVLFTDIFELVYLVVDFIGFFFTFIGACILSAGTNETCDFTDCDHSSNEDWHSGSKAAQAGAWISTFVWLFITLVGFLYLWRNGKLPFLGASSAPPAGPAKDNTAPPIETPPNNPDEMPRY